MSTEFGFNFNKDRCVQCYGCEVACKSWRSAETGVRWRRVSNIWSGSFPKVKMASASVSCMHCADPDCVATCPVSAIRKRLEDGIVVVDRDKCIGCKTCSHSCPFGAPQFGADKKMQKCDMCVNEVDLSKDMPPCADTCPTKALQLGKMEAKEKTSKEKEIQKLLAL
jgi:anaerobic dimethyl sulfoxide reductase subunit B (iron-sulfur subunit)